MSSGKRGIWNWLFLLSSFGLGLVFLILIGQEMFPEWRSYQAQYYRRLAEVTGEPARARAPLGIRQIHLPEMKRVDRCVTCHVGVDNPRMAGQPQPLAAHPDLGIPGFKEAHPFGEIGCTVCHHGQGPATTVRHAHGPVKHWEEPLLPRDLTVAACATCHQNVDTLRGAERLARARLLFEEKGCIGCHNLHGQGMLVGPELDETFRKGSDQFDFHHIEGERTVVNWVVEHFRNPQRVVPGYPALGIPESSMPLYEFDEEQIRMLTALTLSFALETEREEHPIPARFKVAPSPAPEARYASSVELGKAVFKKYGCAGCHGPEGRGGIRNKNMDLAEEVPPLIYVKAGFTREALKATLIEGRYPARARAEEPPPPLWMPAWGEKISPEELEALMDYLFSLSPDAGPQVASSPTPEPASESGPSTTQASPDAQGAATGL